MKTKIFLLFSLVLPLLALGQEPLTNIAEIEVTPPVFTGVENAIDVLSNESSSSIEAYVASRIPYARISRKYKEQGTEVIHFTVTPDGGLTNFQVINSVRPEIDEEVIRILKTTCGMWTPGYNNREPKEMEKEFKIVFTTVPKTGDELVNYFYENAENYFKKGNEKFLNKMKPKKALKYYNKSIRFLPDESASLLLRGLCRYEIGNNEGACSDWNRILSMGKFDADEYLENLCKLKGYAEMKEILNEKFEKTN